jgi:hypothetical protein
MNPLSSTVRLHTVVCFELRDKPQAKESSTNIIL